MTGLTTQNTKKLSSIKNISALDFRAQLETLLEEFSPEVCKVGLINSTDLMVTLGNVIKEKLPNIPLVIDPILSSGSGAKLFTEQIIEGYLQHLAPLAEIITPNLGELRLLSHSKDVVSGVDYLLGKGCKNVLVTDTNPEKEIIINWLFSEVYEQETFEMERYRGEYHGTGCTLSSAVACRLATGMDIRNAVRSAQKYTHSAVQFAHDFGWHQKIPNRFF
jgi:hydroxymethylpyrimidine/phosphomethylpyrimidine kinase